MVLEISRTEKSTAFSFFLFVAFGMVCCKYCSTLPVSGQGQVSKCGEYKLIGNSARCPVRDILMNDF